MATTRARLGPNDRLPCPSPSARKRHAAKAEQCTTCDDGHVDLAGLINAIAAQVHAAHIAQMRAAGITHALSRHEVGNVLVPYGELPERDREDVRRNVRTVLAALDRLGYAIPDPPEQREITPLALNGADVRPATLAPHPDWGTERAGRRGGPVKPAPEEVTHA